MKKALIAHLLVAVSFTLCGSVSALPSDARGVVGLWKMTHDEDGTPSDIMEFRADGTYINHNYRCRASESKYHVSDGDIYVTVEVKGKGPIAIVFRPSADRTKLIFTSPRSRNNATYERLLSSPCQNS